MSETSTDPRAAWLIRLGDAALILGHRLSEWSSRAPTLEEDIALANLARNLRCHLSALGFTQKLDALRQVLLAHNVEHRGLLQFNLQRLVQRGVEDRIAGAIDEMHLAMSPVLLGDGEHLFAGINLHKLGFLVEKTVAGERAGHVVMEKK